MRLKTFFPTMGIIACVAAASAQFDSPPTPLLEDFDDGDDVNNYGGEYRGFAGGDPGGTFTIQDDIMDAVSEDGEGTTGQAGDFGLHVFSSTPLEGDTFIYYGGVVALSPGETTGRDLTGFDTLSFDMKLGSASATTDWAIRLEDTAATNANAGDYQFIDLEPLVTGTTYTNVEISLTDFVDSSDGGTIAPDLTAIDVITFVGKDLEALETDPDMFIDNIQLNTIEELNVAGPWHLLP